MQEQRLITTTVRDQEQKLHAEKSLKKGLR